jgi:hypothetical protein
MVCDICVEAYNTIEELSLSCEGGKRITYNESDVCSAEGLTDTAESGERLNQITESSRVNQQEAIAVNQSSHHVA